MINLNKCINNFRIHYTEFKINTFLTTHSGFTVDKYN